MAGVRRSSASAEASSPQHREHRHGRPRAGSHQKEERDKGRTPEGNEYELLYRGLNAMLRLHVPMDGQVTAEAHSLIAMTGSFDVRTPSLASPHSPSRAPHSPSRGPHSPSHSTHHGSHHHTNGRPLSLTTFVAVRGHGTLYLSHPLPGDITALPLEAGGGPWCIHAGGYFASTKGVRLDGSKPHHLRTAGAPGEAGLTVVQAEGVGTVFLSAVGAMHVLPLPEGEQLTVDPGHLVAWPASVSCVVEKPSPRGWSSMFPDPSAVVCRFRGPGTLYLQSKNEHEFAAWVRRCTAGADPG